MTDLLKDQKSFTSPFLRPETISNAIVNQIITKSGGQVILPKKMTMVSGIRALPTWIQERIRDEQAVTVEVDDAERMKEADRRGIAVK
jgi:all-trans-retinol dehydrogenase (NAD+)